MQLASQSLTNKMYKNLRFKPKEQLGKGQIVTLPDWASMDVTDWAGTDNAVAGVEYCLKTIAQHEPQINSFEHILAVEALSRAYELDQLPASERGALHGVPVAIKAENNVAGVPTSFGTIANSTPAQCESAVVRRLRAAGAIILGTTRMPECGAWSFTESERTITRNPLNPQFSPGGSSGGSAAAVAAGMVPVAIGGDGGGSIRIPAACCGLFGLKPQRGRISTAPYPSLWNNLGVVGPITKSARDLRLLYQQLAGNEPNDIYPAVAPIKPSAISFEHKPQLRVGTSISVHLPRIIVAAEHKAAVYRVASLLDGERNEPVTLPTPTEAFMPLYFSAISEEVADMEKPGLVESRTKQLARIGKRIPKKVKDFALSRCQYYEHQLDEIFAEFDLIITPVIASRPANAGVLTGTNAVAAQLKSAPYAVFTSLWNITGHPAISVPVGYSTRDGLPVAVQLAAGKNQEALLIDAAAFLVAALGDAQW